ncbi:hypothetical protein EV359DRAFT_83315 [Lentinula novae-zelandiae]|nr:hypothetical protein EV359DRAFT_83315 [Lentinula novae-zelandiae]
MEEHLSSKSSMNKPEVFKGKDSNEAHCFRAQFQNWASEQPDLANSQAKLIKSALGFFTEGAGDWATPHLLHFNAENLLRSCTPYNRARGYKSPEIENREGENQKQPSRSGGNADDGERTKELLSPKVRARSTSRRRA